MTPEEKTGLVLALVPATNVDVAQLAASFRSVLNANLVNLTGDPDRDLAVVQTEFDADPDDPGLRIKGIAAAGHCRLDVIATFDKRTADVAIVVTKAEFVANLASPPYGQSGPKLGNSLVFTRLLDAAIPVLVRAGVSTLRNTPYDDRVRAIYKRMGFVDGELLPLNDRDVLLRTFRDAADVAAKSKLLLCPMPP